MTTDDLTNTLQNNISQRIINIIINSIYEGEIDVNDIFNLMKDTQDDKIKFHAAWVLEKLFMRDNKLLENLFTDLLKLFPSIQNIGQKRTLAKIIVKYLDFTFKNKNTFISNKYFKYYNWENIIESLFDSLINRNTPPGLKVLCGYGLAYLSFRYEWIKDELRYQMQSQLNSPAMIAGNKKVSTILSNKCKTII